MRSNLHDFRHFPVSCLEDIAIKSAISIYIDMLRAVLASLGLEFRCGSFKIHETDML
jgi:hypothetical protein